MCSERGGCGASVGHAPLSQVLKEAVAHLTWNMEELCGLQVEATGDMKNEDEDRGRDIVTGSIFLHRL